METQIYIDWINHCGGAWVQTILLWKEWIVCFSLSLSSDGFRLQRQIKLDDQLCEVWLTWQCHCCLSCLQNSATWQFYCCLFCFVQFCPPADVQGVPSSFAKFFCKVLTMLCKVLMVLLHQLCLTRFGRPGHYAAVTESGNLLLL